MRRALNVAMELALTLPPFFNKVSDYTALLASSWSPAPPGTPRNSSREWPDSPDLGSVRQMVNISEITGQPAHGTANGGSVWPLQC